MDNYSDTIDTVGCGVGEQLYDGRFYSHLIGACHYHLAGQGYSGTKSRITPTEDFTPN